MQIIARNGNWTHFLLSGRRGMKRDGERRERKESKHWRCCDRKKMLLSALLKSDWVDWDKGKKKKEKKAGPVLLQTASGSRLGARVAEIWRERHTCHPNEIILQGCWGRRELHRDEILQHERVCVCVCVCEWVSETCSKTSEWDRKLQPKKNCLLIISLLLIGIFSLTRAPDLSSS